MNRRDFFLAMSAVAVVTAAKLPKVYATGGVIEAGPSVLVGEVPGESIIPAMKYALRITELSIYNQFNEQFKTIIQAERVYTADEDSEGYRNNRTSVQMTIINPDSAWLMRTMTKYRECQPLEFLWNETADAPVCDGLLINDVDVEVVREPAVYIADDGTYRRGLR